MNREFIYLLNSGIDIFCSIVLIVILFLTRITIKKTNSNKQFMLLSLSILLFNLGDLSNWICEGLSHSWNIPVLHIMTFLYYLSQPLMFVFFLGFLRERYYDKKFNPFLYRICIFICSIDIIFVLLSVFPGFFYKLSADNYYSRTKLYGINIGTILTCYFLCISHIFILRKQISKKEFLSSLSFPVLPLFFNVPQFLFYGIASVNIGLIISIVFLYANIYRQSKAQKQEEPEFTSELFIDKDSFSFFEKLRRFCFYYGYSQEAINSIQDKLNSSTLIIHRMIYSTGTIVSSLMLISSFFIERISVYKFIYVVLSIICCSSYLISRFIKSNSKAFLPLCLTTIFAIAGILIYGDCVINPLEKSVILICFLFGIPILYCYKPCITWLSIASFNVIAIDLFHIYKPADIALSDSINILVVSILGLIIGYQVSKIKIKSTYLGKNLDKEITVKTEQINGFYHEIVRTLTSSIESKDDYTNGHSERVANYSVMIAKRLGWSDDKCNELWMEAILHDVGKIGIPDSILKKTDKLTDEEFAVIQTHTVQGEKILMNLKSFPNAKDAAKYHHEKYNGKGYPSHLKEEEIPINARIVAIADAFDAMTSSRCYRPALKPEIVISELEKGRGTQFDPDFIDIFLDILKENKEIVLS